MEKNRVLISHPAYLMPQEPKEKRTLKCDNCNLHFARLFLHTHYAYGMGDKLPPRLSRLLGHLRTASNGYTNVFEAQLFNGVVDNVTESRVVGPTGNRYGVCPKPEVTLAQQIGQLETKFQQLYPYSRGRAVQWCCRQCHRKSSYNGNKYGGRPNRK